MKFVKQLSSIVNEFVEKNGKLIAGTILFSVIAAIAKDYGYLSPNYGFSNNGEFKFSMKPEPKEEKRDWTNDVNLMPPITNSFQTSSRFETKYHLKLNSSSTATFVTVPTL